MTRVRLICGLFLCVVSLASNLCAQTTAPATGDQDEQAMLQTYRSMGAPLPDMSRVKNQAYVDSYLKECRASELKQADFAKAFHDKFPNDPSANEMMQERWMTLARFGQTTTLLAETDQALAGTLDAAAKTGILFLRAEASINAGSDKAADAIDEFLQAAPDDPRGSENVCEKSIYPGRRR